MHDQRHKNLGGQHSHYVFCEEVCLGLQKNLGSRIFIGRNTILYPFWWLGAFLHIFYIGKYGKTVKITYFDVLSPLNGVFCANFIPYPKGHNVRNILGQLLNIEIFALWNGGASKMQKMIIFDHFSGQNCIVACLWPL